MTAPLHSQPRSATGKLPSPPAAHPAAHSAAHPAPEHHAAPAPKHAPAAPTVAQLRAAATREEGPLPWHNNGDLNNALGAEITQKINAAHARSGTAVNAIIRSVINANRSKLQNWNYNWTEGADGKVKLDLMFQGKMNAFADSSGVTLSDSLNGFLNHGGDRTLASAVLDQIAHPGERIKQIREFTCVAADVQRQIAKMNPQKYFVFATELLTHGEAKLPNGKELSVSKANRAWIDAQPHMSENTKINAYFQCSLMEFANGKGRYLISDDRSLNGKNEPAIKGMGIEQAVELTNATQSGSVVVPVGIRDQLKREHRAVNPQNFMQAIEQQLSHNTKNGLLVPIKVVGPDGQPGYHAVVLGGVNGNDITLYNPDDRNQSTVISKSKFEKMLAIELSNGDSIGDGTGIDMTNTSTTGFAPPAPTTTAAAPRRR